MISIRGLSLVLATAMLSTAALPTVVIREFSLAIAVTKNYSAQFPTATYNEIFDRVQEAVDQLDGIFRRDAQIGFGLVWIQIYDPRFPEGGDDDFAGCVTVADYLARNQVVLDGNYGWSYPAYYEIGHCLFRASGQPSQGTLNSLGILTQRGRGASNIVRNDEDPEREFQTLFHEIAHQCGAKHTFASFLHADPSQRHADSAVEIGAGITLMSYQGSCGDDNYFQYEILPPTEEPKQSRLHAFSVGRGATTGSPPSIWNHVRNRLPGGFRRGPRLCGYCPDGCGSRWDGFPRCAIRHYDVGQQWRLQVLGRTCGSRRFI